MVRGAAFAFLSALLLVGCNSSPSSSSTTGSAGTTGATDAGSSKPADTGKKLRIAFIPKGATHEFWKTMHAGAEKAAGENNVDLLWKSPEKEDDTEGQISVVEGFINQKVDGIILAPLNDEALRQPVKAAQDAGIPVIIVDSGLKDVKTNSFIATDNQAAGKMGGEALAKAVGPKGRVILLRYAEASASTMAREAGFLEAAKAAGLNVVSSEQYAGVTRETAQTASENLIARFKKGDGIDADGIFTPNESTSFGMLRALQNAKLIGKVKFIGFDSSKELLDAIRSGDMQGVVLQNPSKMGYQGIVQMVAAINKKDVPEKIDTGALLLTKDNIDSPEAKDVLPKQ